MLLGSKTFGESSIETVLPLNGNGARLFALMCQFTTAPSGVIDDLRLGLDWATVTGGPGIYASPTNQTRNAGTNATLPVDLYVRRRGSTFEAYVKDRGNCESGMPRLVGTVTLPVGDLVEFGFAMTSHDRTQLAKATFDHPAC